MVQSMKYEETRKSFQVFAAEPITGLEAQI